MPEFYIPDAATLRAERIDLTTDALLASKGFDPANAQPINAPKIVGEAFEDETIYDVDRHTWRPEYNALTSEAALEGEADDITARDSYAEGASDFVSALDDDTEEASDDIEGVQHALDVAIANVKAHPADGDNVRLLALEREAVEIHRELKSLVAERTRKTLSVHELYSGKLADAVKWGNWPEAFAHLRAGIRDDKADHALKVACVKAAIEIASLCGADDGTDFDARWLAKIADIPLRTAQDLLTSAHALESGIASMLVGTEDGGRKGVRALAAMTPARRRKAVEALREHLTLSLLEFAAKREKARRTRSVSLSELDALTAIGLNNRTGWAALTELSVSDGKRWLAATLDKCEAAERRHGDDAEPRGPDARVNGRRVVRSLTMQRLASERIYEL
jgi:hypothetical protein